MPYQVNFGCDPIHALCRHFGHCASTRSHKRGVKHICGTQQVNCTVGKTCTILPALELKVGAAPCGTECGRIRRGVSRWGEVGDGCGSDSGRDGIGKARICHIQFPSLFHLARGSLDLLCYHHPECLMASEGGCLHSLLTYHPTLP